MFMRKNSYLLFGMKYLNGFILLMILPLWIHGQEAGIEMARKTIEGNRISPASLEANVPSTVEPKDETTVKLTLFLEGPFGEGKMNTDLNKSGLIPLSQPYNLAPWNYYGTEAVDSIPAENIVDWVLVDIRSADSAGNATPSTVFARKAGFLLNNGLITNIDGSTMLSFDTVFS